MSDDELPVEPGSAWVQHLERAHALAHEAARAIEQETEPNSFLRPGARTLEAGIGAMYDAFDGRRDRTSAIASAHAKLWETAVLLARGGLPHAVASVRRACAELIASEERFPNVRLAGVKDRVLVAAKTDLPVHAVRRPSITPVFRAPPMPPQALDRPVRAEVLPGQDLAQVAAAAKREAEAKTSALLSRPPPRALTLADLRAKEPQREAPPDGFAFAPPPPMSPSEFRLKWARECFDEVGMLGIQRAPVPGDDWREIASLERRMFWSIDALAALGPVAVAHVEQFALDAPAADPIKVFAAALLGGCFDGRDALAGAERVLHRFGAGDPLVASSFVSAMKIAPHPHLANAMRTLARSADPASRAIGVEVLAHRGLLSNGELHDLADERDPVILGLALPALAASRHPDLDRALASAQAAGVVLLGPRLDAMLLGAHGQALEEARRAAEANEPTGWIALAQVCDRPTAEWILGESIGHPDAIRIEAIGWTGLLDAVPLLVSWLGSEDEDVSRAAGSALDRILGAGLVDLVDVLPEDLDDVAVRDPDRSAAPKRTLADLVSDPRDKPPPGSTEKLEVPSTDAEKWNAWWTARRSDLDPKLRYRRGRAFTPTVLVYELDRQRLSAIDRGRVHRELAARTGRITRFDPHDLVAVQERSLASWSSLAAQAGAAEGSWARPIAR